MTKTDYYNKYCEANPDTFDGSTIGLRKEMNQFLANRIFLAFDAGYSAGGVAERERVRRAIVDLLGI